jgi:alpha-glucoside transport system substrate-binding protein
MLNRKRLKWFSLLLILSLVLVACGGDETGNDNGVEPAATEATSSEDTETEEDTTEEDTGDAEPAEVDFAVMPGGFLEQALAGEFEGTTVIVDGPFVDADEVRFNASIAPFEEATGIDVQYIGSKEFEASIAVRVDAGDAPDIADFPQPGLLGGFVRQGKVVDVSEWITADWLAEQYNPSWLDMAQIEGPDGPITAGVWHRFNGKSLVWYPIDDFEAAGYTVPTTWEEMQTLMDQIVADGDTPWCIGIGSGTATGWPATDWTEEMMLRTTSLENYDAWTRGELPFDSPEVRTAIETWSELWFNDDYVFGGRSSIVSTNFDTSPLPMFDDPPQCWMHKQGNFITGFFPEGSVAGTDYGFFYLPPVDDAYGRPFLVAGDIMAMFNDRPEVRALMEYFTVPESAGGWLSDGGALAAHQTATPDMYGVDLERGIAELVSQATSFRFDGSDLMPGEVGAGTFWTGMVNYVSGTAELDTVLQEIDASWPTD